jgi:NADPH2:quinone reductase
VGVTIIGTVGTPGKAELARSLGCDHTILYRETDFAAEVANITGGRGVDVVFDSVGLDTFAGSLSALAVRGHLVNYGQSSGPVEPLAMSRLAAKSLSVTRPILFHYLTDSEQYRAMANDVFSWLAEETLRQEPPQRVPLADAHKAHEALETRSTTAPVILTA